MGYRGKKSEKQVDVLPIIEQRACFIIRGTAPYVSGKMPKFVFDDLARKAEHPEEKDKKPPPVSFKRHYHGTMHITKKGIYGIPSNGLQTALIDASRSADIKMTLSKQTLTIEPEGFDIDDNNGLSLIIKDKPSMLVSRVGAGKAAFCARARWSPGWEARVIIRWNGSKISANGITALLTHAGRYIGVGAGRPFSENSCGCGWGTFEIVKAFPLEIKSRSKLLKTKKIKKSSKKR